MQKRRKNKSGFAFNLEKPVLLLLFFPTDVLGVRKKLLLCSLFTCSRILLQGSKRNEPEWFSFSLPAFTRVAVLVYKFINHS